jgi:hypothetical protein
MFNSLFWMRFDESDEVVMSVEERIFLNLPHCSFILAATQQLLTQLLRLGWDLAVQPQVFHSIGTPLLWAVKIIPHPH